jgi:hypothetical protein
MWNSGTVIAGTREHLDFLVLMATYFAEKGICPYTLYGLPVPNR